jgi:hypothetical protein
MTEESLSDRTPQPQSFQDWLKSEVTLRLPRWALVAGGVAAFALILVALD